MKFSLSVILTMLGGIGVSLWAYTPWWGFVPVAFVLAILLPLQGSSAALILLTGILGGILGGVAALAGSYLRVIKSKSE